MHTASGPQDSPSSPGSGGAVDQVARVLDALRLTVDPRLIEAVSGLELIDHHCHGINPAALGEAELTDMLGEAALPEPPGCSRWDASLGIALRTLCSAPLGIEATPSGAGYITRRHELGADQANRLLLSAPGAAGGMLIDTGYRGQEILGLQEMADVAGVDVWEIVRLEALAEAVARQGATPATYAESFSAAVADENPTAVGWKSIAAYRGGLDIDWSRPAPGRVRDAAAEWLRSGPRNQLRMDHPVLIAFGVWCAVDTAKMIQFHTGFGDTDADVRSSNPVLLGSLAADTLDSGAGIALLHTWPHHREAGYLAAMWPHVYCDVGEALPHVGLGGVRVMAEMMELAPWHKALYSSDAWGLSELHYLGAILSRAALAAALDGVVGLGLDLSEAIRLGRLVAGENARRAYKLSG